MKRLTTILLVTVVLFQIACGATPEREVEKLSDAEYRTIFSEVDTNGSGTLAGSEVREAAARAIAAIFRANNYFDDKEMIAAIAEDLTKSSGELTQEQWRTFAINLPGRIVTFRERVFDQLLEAYGVAKLMEDYDIASEVYSQPDVYGLTYAAHRVLFFDFKAAVEKAQAEAKRGGEAGSRYRDL